jgi:hypothetical protein
MQSMQYQWLTRRAGRIISTVRLYFYASTYDLELDRDDPEVQHLHHRPEHIVCLQSWQVDVLELMGNGSLPTTLGDGHERKEAGET